MRQQDEATPVAWEVNAAEQVEIISHLKMPCGSRRDEKSPVHWRIKTKHHEAQQKGRVQILQDYHLRIGPITLDTEVPKGQAIVEQRLDEAEVGEGTTVTLITIKRPTKWKETTNPADAAQAMGLDPRTVGLPEWDLFDAVLPPSDLIAFIHGVIVRPPSASKTSLPFRTTPGCAGCAWCATIACSTAARRRNTTPTR
jgi:hypothetical protein